jgi:hypothetical protein
MLVFRRRGWFPRDAKLTARTHATVHCQGHGIVFLRPSVRYTYVPRVTAREATHSEKPEVCSLDYGVARAHHTGKSEQGTNP